MDYLFTLAVPVFGDTLFEALFLQYGHTKFLVICNGIYTIIKIPVTMILMFLAVKMIYAMAPDEEVPTKDNLLGPFLLLYYGLLVQRFTRFM